MTAAQHTCTGLWVGPGVPPICVARNSDHYGAPARTTARTKGGTR